MLRCCATKNRFHKANLLSNPYTQKMQLKPSQIVANLKAKQMGETSLGTMVSVNRKYFLCTINVNSALYIFAWLSLHGSVLLQDTS